MNKTLGFLLASLIGGDLAHGWNAEGHMVVAQIAYSHLQPAVKAKCDALIAVPLGSFSSSTTSEFITSACWADDFKTTLTTGGWHYIDLAFSLDGSSVAGAPTDPSNIVAGVNLCIATLQNPAETLSNQAVCLRYLIHFVGDIQQPLHCSTAVIASDLNGDAGGNGFSLTGLWSNLHALWDAGGNFLPNNVSRPLSNSGRTTLSNKVGIVEGFYPYDYTTNLFTVPDVLLWAREGSNLAETVCYVGITRGGSPSSSYLTTATNTTIQRMAMGGRRLADLLNTVFATNAVTLTPRPLTNGNFAFSWPGLTNRNYRVQWKQDVTDALWNDLTNIVNPGNQPILITDPANQPRRIYRVTQ